MLSQACTACNTIAPDESRWKAVALFVGAVLFCPCHLPVTIAAVAAFGGAAWLAGQAALLYLVFGLTYLLLVALGLRYLIRRRDAEREAERLHAAHAGTAS